MAQLDDVRKMAEKAIGEVGKMTPEDLAAGAELTAEAAAGAVGDLIAGAELAAEAAAKAIGEAGK